MEQNNVELEKFKQDFLVEQKRLQKMFIEVYKKLNIIKKQDCIKEPSLSNNIFLNRKFEELYNDFQNFIYATSNYNEEVVENVLESLKKVNQLPITNNVLPELIILYKSYERLKNNIVDIYNDFNSISNSVTGKLLTDGLLLDYETYAIMVAKSLNTQYQIYKQSIKIIDTYNQSNNNNHTL